MGIPTRSKERERRLNARKLLLFSSLVFFVLWGIGAWYRSTIHDWDYCVRNNRCFVCHAPAVAAEHTYEDLGKNVRLCPEHSTGPQAWRWIVYGVPATLFIYEDAPLGTGWIFTPLIRWALILMWGGAAAAAALLTALSITQLAFPQKGFLGDLFCNPCKTCSCGQPLEIFEVRCQQCTLDPGIGPDWCVLLAAPCLRSRIANFAGAAVGFAAVVLLIVAGDWLLLFLLGGKGQTAVNALATLCIFVAILGLLVVVPMLWQDIKDPPYFEITVTNAIRKLFIPRNESREPKFLSGDVPLKDVTSIRVSAGRIARWLKYGDVVLCTIAKPDGALTCEALDKPYLFREKVEWLVKQQPVISRLLVGSH
jgi:hypothetical protein